MGKLTKSIEIEASPEKVFDFINDTERMNKAHEGFTQATYTSKGPVGLGTTMHMVGKHGGSNLEWDMKITEFEKNKKVTMYTETPSRMKLALILEPTAKGTNLTQALDYEVPYSFVGKIVDKLKVSKDVDKEVTLFFEKAKKSLEE